MKFSFRLDFLKNVILYQKNDQTLNKNHEWAMVEEELYYSFISITVKKYNCIGGKDNELTNAFSDDTNKSYNKGIFY